MDDLKVTDADREAAERAWPMMSIAKVAEVFAEVRAAGVAQERERWAAIVQQETGYQAGVAAERERCAKFVDELHHDDNWQEPRALVCKRIAAAIRAGEVRG